MASKRNEAKCRICDIYVRKSSGTLQFMSSDQDVSKFSPFFEEVIRVGDYLCHSCRCNKYKRKRIDTTASPSGIESSAVIESSANMEPSTSSNNKPPSNIMVSEPLPSVSNKKSAVSLKDVEKNAAASIEPPADDTLNSSIQSFSYSSVDDPSVKFTVAPIFDIDYIEIQMQRTFSSHKCCCICRDSANLTLVPSNARTQCLIKRNIYIPTGNRCCKKHLIHGRFYEDDLQKINVYSKWSTIDSREITNLMQHLRVESDTTLLDRIHVMNISEKELKVYTGLNWENICELDEMLKSLRNSTVRSTTQAIAVFLCRMRTANSNKLIAAMLGMQNEQDVSHYCNQVINAFEKDVLEDHFGLKAATREIIIENTTLMAEKIIDNSDNKLILIFDGTYAYHQKSTNSEFQRISYSGQKKTHLLKPFTICTTNGYIVDMLGPYKAVENDATIMRKIVDGQPEFSNLLEAGDICIVDRGFRDVSEYLSEKGYRVLMPAFKGKKNQLSTVEANESRYVTKIRWAIESTHGMIKKKYPILDQFDNKMVDKVGPYYRIASFLHNKYSKRLSSDVGYIDEVVTSMGIRRFEENTLAVEVDEMRWKRRTTPFEFVLPDDLSDFPRINEADLKILFTGSYQLRQAVSYLAEMMDSDGNVNIKRVKDRTSILKLLVQSRHVKSKEYRCFIEYSPEEVMRYCCECANGLRTVGCCSHVAAVIYYLAHGRYLSRILRPAQVLSRMFETEDPETVIDEDSDND